MLENLDLGNLEIKIDPESSFWGIGEKERLEAFYSGVKDELIREIEDFRFNRELILLYVNPTDKCNASCPYCYLPGEIKARQKSMSYEELEKIADKAFEYFEGQGIKGSIVFHGSEPLMNKKNIFRIIEDYNDRINFGIQTNGLLLTEEDAEFIKNKGVNIGISLDSPDRKINDYLRGEGHYNHVAKALEWFRGYRGLNVVTTITKYNQSQLVDMVEFLHSHEVSLCLMNPVRGTQESSLALRPEPSHMAKEFIKAVDKAIELTKAGRRIVIGDFANILLGIVAPTARVLMCDISPCGAGRRFFAVTAEGSCYPCGEFIGIEEFSGGNIFSRSIDEISKSENFRRVIERKVEKIEECSTCLLRNICGAPCPAELYSSSGSMYRKSYYCDFYKEVIEHAFRVILNQDVWYVLRKSALKVRYQLDLIKS